MGLPSKSQGGRCPCTPYSSLIQIQGSIEALFIWHLSFSTYFDYVCDVRCEPLGAAKYSVVATPKLANKLTSGRYNRPRRMWEGVARVPPYYEYAKLANKEPIGQKLTQ